MRDLLRFALGIIVVGAFLALLLLERSAEAIAALAPLASMIVIFYFRKSGPSAGGQS